MNNELIEALDALEKEKHIKKVVLIEAIENSLIAACKNNFGKADNIKVIFNKDNGSVTVYAQKEIVEEVEDSALQISKVEADLKFPGHEIGEIVNVEVTPKNFGRIAAQKAKQVVVQKIREEERNSLFNRYYDMEHELVTGVIQRRSGNNISVNLGKLDAMLTEEHQIKAEKYRPNERMKFYVTEVTNTTKGPRISISRTDPTLVRRLFEAEVAEVKDGTVEIMGIAREPGSRTKIAVQSHEPNVDPVGACVGMNGRRISNIVSELGPEKIDIITWNEDPAVYIENALRPSTVVYVRADVEEKTAKVIVPDDQLTLAIGRAGQNVRLAARLTGYRIDIKSESQAAELDMNFDENEAADDENIDDVIVDDVIVDVDEVVEDTAADETNEQ